MRTLREIVSTFDEVWWNEVFSRITEARSVIAAVAGPEVISDLVCASELCGQWWR